MNTISLTILFGLIFSFASSSQSLKVAKIIVDKSNKQPLEYVNIYNEKDNSVSNTDGLFIFVSDKKEINFNLLGYIPIETTFERIEKQDTIFMQPKIFELKDVVVTNVDPFIKKALDKWSGNLISNYTSNFFLRNVLRSDSVIVKLQDIYGKKNKNYAQKENTKIEILNMRKIGLFEKKNRIDLIFPDFNEFFSPPFFIIDKCTFSDVDYKDVDYRKVLFESKEKDGWGQIVKGYFIINRNDYAIVEYYITMYDNPEAVPYKKILLSGTQYRTIKYSRLMHFTKSVVLNKYYLSNSKLDSEVEVLADTRIEKTFYYNLAMYYFATNDPTNEIINSNFPVDKDIFKVKFPFSEKFWNNQNQLPLTNELEDFLKKVSENRDKKKEYEIIGNF